MRNPTSLVGGEFHTSHCFIWMCSHFSFSTVRDPDSFTAHIKPGLTIMGTAVGTLPSLYETQNEIHTHITRWVLSSANLDGCKSSLVLESWEQMPELAAVTEAQVLYLHLQTNLFSSFMTDWGDTHHGCNKINTYALYCKCNTTALYHCYNFGFLNVGEVLIQGLVCKATVCLDSTKH